VRGQIISPAFSTASDYSLRFKLKFNSIESDLAGLVLFSATSRDDGVLGDRIPVIYSCPGATSLRIIQDNVQISGFYCSPCTRNLQLNVWYLIEIYAVGNLFQNYIDGQLEQSCSSTGDRPTQNVVVYASSPFTNPANAFISDLIYEDLSGVPASLSIVFHDASHSNNGLNRNIFRGW
jgi:hypothetical protein